MPEPLSAKKITDPLQKRAWRLGLYGPCAHWGDVPDREHLDRLVGWEEQERARRSLDRRLRDSHIGRFKPLADFDWTWPQSIDRAAVEDLMTLDFRQGAGARILGAMKPAPRQCATPGTVRALVAGHTVRFTTASALLGDLAVADGAAERTRKLRQAARPDLLVIDELGYLSYDNRYADLLF